VSRTPGPGRAVQVIDESMRDVIRHLVVAQLSGTGRLADHLHVEMIGSQGCFLSDVLHSCFSFGSHRLSHIRIVLWFFFPEIRLVSISVKWGPL
jgi:hypothetical protein